MQVRSSKTSYAAAVLLSLLTLNNTCAQAVGPAPPTPPPVPTNCFGPDARTEVTVHQHGRSPARSELRRVSWTFRVGCPPSRQVYTFGVRQSIDNGLELNPPPPVDAPALVFAPSDEPFKFYIEGPVHGYWCSTAVVELMDGTVLRTREFRVPQFDNPPRPIAAIVSWQDGVNRADPASGYFPEQCPFR